MAVVVADFNGDRKLDTAVANSGSENLSVLLGNGDGTFQPAVNFDAGIKQPIKLATGDFNQDGRSDLAVFQPGDTGTLAPGELSILLGNGDGSFQTPRITTLPVATDMAIADFNLDHKTDIAVTAFESNTEPAEVLLLLGSGEGSFQVPKQVAAIPSAPLGGAMFLRYIAAADFNGDGKPDLVLQLSTALGVLLGNGDGTFRAAQSAAVATGFVVENVYEIEDVNGDGKPDVIVGSFSFTSSGVGEGASSQRTDHFSVFLGNGDVTFQAEQVVASSHWSKANVYASSMGDAIASALG